MCTYIQTQNNPQCRPILVSTLFLLTSLTLYYLLHKHLIFSKLSKSWFFSPSHTCILKSTTTYEWIVETNVIASEIKGPQHQRWSNCPSSIKCIHTLINIQILSNHLALVKAKWLSPLCYICKFVNALKQVPMTQKNSFEWWKTTTQDSYACNACKKGWMQVGSPSKPTIMVDLHICKFSNAIQQVCMVTCLEACWKSK